MARARAVVTSWPRPRPQKAINTRVPSDSGCVCVCAVGVVVGGRDSVGLVYIGLATQESFADLRLSPGSSLAPGICRDPSMIFTIN